jgi:hypothetical protein
MDYSEALIMARVYLRRVEESALEGNGRKR